MCPLIVKLDIKNCRSSAWGCMFFFLVMNCILYFQLLELTTRSDMEL